MTAANDFPATDSEEARVKRLLSRFSEAIGALRTPDIEVEALVGFRLPYANEILSYKSGSIESLSRNSPPYETDLLIRDVNAKANSWIPRVVIEFKFGQVTTHDALTYSAKAFTHKHVHPYLRYGTIIGGFDKIPPRLVRHGVYFDFIAVWNKAEPSNEEWQDLTEILSSEVLGSRRMQQLLAGDGGCCRLHKQLRFKPI